MLMVPLLRLAHLYGMPHLAMDRMSMLRECLKAAGRWGSRCKHTQSGPSKDTLGGAAAGMALWGCIACVVT